MLVKSNSFSSKFKISLNTINNMKSYIALTIIFTAVIFLSTGCDLINKTFGKEYLLVDEFFDQLEADMRYSVDDFIAAKGMTNEQEKTVKTNINKLYAELKIERIEMKSKIPGLAKLLPALEYGGSTSDFIEKTLIEERIDIEKQLSNISNGQFMLKSAKVNRGFLGSIWHFVRSHWLISLIILCVLGAIWEKHEDFIDSILNKKANDGTEEKMIGTNNSLNQ